MAITLDTKTIGLITVFENVTKAPIKDCFLDDSNNMAYFIVDEGKIGLAIGRNGEGVKSVERLIKKNVKIFEFSKDLETFVKNVIPYVNTVRIKNSGKDVVVEVNVDKRSKALVIGRDGRNLKLYRKLLMRNHDVSGVVVR